MGISIVVSEVGWSPLSTELNSVSFDSAVIVHHCYTYLSLCPLGRYILIDFVAFCDRITLKLTAAQASLSGSNMERLENAGMGSMAK